MEKSNKAALRKIINFRVTDETYNLLKAKSIKENSDLGLVTREIISLYFEDKLSDSKIYADNLAKTKNKLNMLENKIEILSLLVLELTQAYTQTFPDNGITPDLSEQFYSEIIKKLSNSMKNHKGKLEAMVLDIYEKTGEM